MPITGWILVVLLPVVVAWMLTHGDEPPRTASEPCPRAWCRGRVPHSLVAHWLGWARS